MFDCHESFLSLLINDRCEPVVLLLYFLDNLLFDAFLLRHRVFHIGAVCESFIGLLEEFLKLINLVRARLLKCHTATTSTMIVEVAIVTEGLIMDPAVCSK